MGVRGRRTTEAVIHTEESIQKNLFYRSPFITKPKFVVLGLFVYMWESDYLAVTASGYTYEAEIKISHSDFLNDAKHKAEKMSVLKGDMDGSRPNYFYYVCPRGVIGVEEVPEFAGLLYIDDNGYFSRIKEAPKLHNAKHSLSEEYLAGKFYYGMWNYIRRHWERKKEDLSNRERIAYEKSLDTAHLKISELEMELKAIAGR